MAAEGSMKQAIMQTIIEGAKAAIMAVREGDNPTNNATTIHITQRLGGPALRRPMKQS